MVSLDKSLEVNHISARVGDNVEIKCDVTGTPPPPLIWRRYGIDVETLSEPEVSCDNSIFPSFTVNPRCNIDRIFVQHTRMGYYNILDEKKLHIIFQIVFKND